MGQGRSRQQPPAIAVRVQSPAMIAVEGVDPREPGGTSPARETSEESLEGQIHPCERDLVALGVEGRILRARGAKTLKKTAQFIDHLHRPSAELTLTDGES